TASTAWPGAPSQTARASSRSGRARGCCVVGARWALRRVRAGPWVIRTRVEDNPGAIPACLDRDRVVLLVAGNVRGGDRVGGGRRRHDRGADGGEVRGIRDVLFTRPPGRADPRRPRRPQTPGPEGPAVGAVGRAVASHPRARATGRRAG